MDYCSESESDVEASTVSSTWQDFHADSSNDESVDSEAEDPLKYALFFKFYFNNNNCKYFQTCECIHSRRDYPDYKR